MDTLPVTTAPTEEEIRAAIARQWRWSPPNPPCVDVQFEDGIGATQQLLDGLYDQDDLRRSERDRLDELTFAAMAPIRAETRRQINEAMVKAALIFAAEHPDASRAYLGADGNIHPGRAPEASPAV